MPEKRMIYAAYTDQAILKHEEFFFKIRGTVLY